MGTSEYFCRERGEPNKANYKDKNASHIEKNAPHKKKNS